MKSRDIAIVGICLAVGAILRIIANAVSGFAIVANPVIALYCLAIILVRPKISEALGIGLVAGILSMLISHSLFPPANLISEPFGALVCVLVYMVIAKRVPLAEAGSTFIATLASGLSFLLVCIFVIAFTPFLDLPNKYETLISFFGTLAVFVVVPTAFVNGIITQVLYYPTSKMIMKDEE